MRRRHARESVVRPPPLSRPAASHRHPSAVSPELLPIVWSVGGWCTRRSNCGPSILSRCQGRDVTGCSCCLTNERHCFANARVGNQPAGIIPAGGRECRSIDAVLTDQFVLPHVSFVL